jgi:hypothetical protein
MKKLRDWWKNSFVPFKGKQGLLLLISTIKTSKRVSLLLCRYFWWLILADILLCLWLYPTLSYPSRSLLGFAAPVEPTVPGAGTKLLVYFLIKLILSFFTVLAARPSLENKNSGYFSYYMKNIGGFMFLFTLLVGGIYIFPLQWLSMLFFFDTSDGKGKIRSSLCNGLKTMWYFLPVVLVAHSAEFICDYVISTVLNSLAPLITFPLLFVMVRTFLYTSTWIILLSLVTNWYVVIKQNNYTLFFKHD